LSGIKKGSRLIRVTQLKIIQHITGLY